MLPRKALEVFVCLSAFVWLLVGSPSGAPAQPRPARAQAKSAATGKPSTTKQRPRWQPRSVKARQKLNAAERQLSQSMPGPPMDGNWEADGITSNRFYEAEEIIQASLAIEPSGRAYRDLGKYHFRMGNYNEAGRAFTQAWKISPSVVSARIGRIQAYHALYIKASIKPLLPENQELLHLIPFPIKGQRLWAVLSSERLYPEPGSHRENGLISVFEEKGHRLSLHWRSKIIASIEHREYFSLDLWAFPMTGRRIPELVLMGVCGGGSANPTLFHIYRWTGNTFRQVLDTESGEQPLWIEDLNHIGRYQVRCVQLVGKDLAHCRYVRWASIYDWNGKRYMNADANYPRAFRKARTEILERLENHPDDPVLLKYLGKSYLYEGRRRLAYAAFDRMERACRELIKDDLTDIVSWWNLADIAEIRGKRRRAVERFRNVVRISHSLAKKEIDPDTHEYYLGYAKEAAARIQKLRHDWHH